MIKSDIIKKYKTKIKDFNKHSKLYYDKSNPVISDSEFDKLKQEILDLEKNFPYLISKKSLLNFVTTMHSLRESKSTPSKSQIINFLFIYISKLTYS